MNEQSVEFSIEVEGEGPAFLWGHGLMGSMKLDAVVDLVQLDALADSAKVVRYDARGHGLSEGSDDPEHYRWKALGGDMLEVADQAEVEGFVAGGQSLGAASSIFAALTAPERVKGLVLVTPPAAWETRAGQAELYNKLATLVEFQGVDAFVELLGGHRYFPQWLEEAQPSLRETFIKHFGLLDAGSIAKILRGAARSNLPPVEELAAINAPTLILAWDDDISHPLSTSRELDNALQNSQLIEASSMDDLRLWPGLVKKFVEQVG